MEQPLKAFATVNKGMEKVLAQELTELGCKNCNAKTEFVMFETDNYEKLCQLCYTARGLNKIILFLTEIKLNNFEYEAKKKIEKIDFTKFLTQQNTFKATYEKSLSATDDGREITGTIGGLIQEKTRAKVNLTNPELQIFCLIFKNETIIGIDFAGEDLGKRDYRIFLGHDSLKGNVAFNLLKIANYNPKLSLLDTFCRAGAISIEAALLANQQSPHFYNKKRFAFLKLPFLQQINFDKIFKETDKKIKKVKPNILCFDQAFQNVAAAKKNAKIAGVLDEIQFSRSDVEWIDIKLEKNSIDRIVTFPIQPSKITPQKKIEKTYEWLFKNSKILLKKEGQILVLAKNNSEELLTKFAQQEGFLIKEKNTFYQGAEKLITQVFAP